MSRAPSALGDRDVGAETLQAPATQKVFRTKEAHTIHAARNHPYHSCRAVT